MTYTHFDHYANRHSIVNFIETRKESNQHKNSSKLSTQNKNSSRWSVKIKFSRIMEAATVVVLISAISFIIMLGLTSLEGVPKKPKAVKQIIRIKTKTIKIVRRDHESSVKSNKTSNLIALVLSSRQASSAKSRAVIRETWLSDESKGVFLVGKDFCPFYDEIRTKSWDCKLDTSKNISSKTLEDYTELEKNITSQLSREKNVLMLPMTDTYLNLTLKVKLGIKWAVENTSAKWFLKVDDDAYAYLSSIEQFLEQFDHNQPYLIGRITNHVHVMNDNTVGKFRWQDERWLDNKYKSTKIYTVRFKITVLQFIS